MQNAVECVLVLFAGEPIAEYAFGLVEQCLSSFRFATAVVFDDVCTAWRKCMEIPRKTNGNMEKMRFFSVVVTDKFAVHIGQFRNICTV